MKLRITLIVMMNNGMLLSILATHPCKLDLVPYTSLKCLASQAIR